MTLESGPKNLEGGKIEAPRASQEMPGAEAHDDVARDDLSGQESEDRKEKDGAVKKKIDIPGVGEIEYTEKKIMFPEKIVQETGGVKGYVRKMVSWDELARFWGMQPEEFQKIIKGSLTSREKIRELNNYRKKKNEEAIEWRKKNPELAKKYPDWYEIYDNILADEELNEYPEQKMIDFYLEHHGILTIILKLTDGELIEKTLNHIVGGHQNYASREDVATKDCVLGKFGDARSLGFKYFRNVKFYGCDLATNQILSYEELFEKAGIDKDLLVKYNEMTLSDKEKQIFLEKIFNTKNVYFQQNRGISLTTPGELWRSSAMARDEQYSNWETCDIPYLKDIIIGFKKQSGNPVFKKYHEKVLPIMQDQAEKVKLTAHLDPRKWKKGYGTNDFNQALATLLSFDKPKYYRKVGIITGSSNEGKHPQIPIVLNHPDIPELRWCHADYAAIPTKNGYNIIEMIT